MEQKTNASTAAERIVQLVGGTENIRAVTHCLTRLRFDLLSRECADDAQIKTIPEVLGIVFRAGQYQIVLNQNLYPVFNAIASRYPDMCRSIADESSSCGFGDEAAESRR